MSIDSKTDYGKVSKLRALTLTNTHDPLGMVLTHLLRSPAVDCSDPSLSQQHFGADIKGYSSSYSPLVAKNNIRIFLIMNDE